MQNHDPLIASLFIMILLILMPFYLLKRLSPTSYRLTTRLTKSLAKPLILTQAQRRGVLFVLCVHLPFVLVILFTLSALLGGTPEPLFPALLCFLLALGAKRGLSSLRRLRSHRTRLPGWRK